MPRQERWALRWHPMNAAVAATMRVAQHGTTPTTPNESTCAALRHLPAHSPTEGPPDERPLRRAWGQPQPTSPKSRKMNAGAQGAARSPARRGQPSSRRRSTPAPQAHARLARPRGFRGRLSPGVDGQALPPATPFSEQNQQGAMAKAEATAGADSKPLCPRLGLPAGRWPSIPQERGGAVVSVALGSRPSLLG